MQTPLSKRLTELLYDEDYWEDAETYKAFYRRPQVSSRRSQLTRAEYEQQRTLPTVDLEQLVRDCYICMSWLSARLNSWEIYDYVISMTGVHINDEWGRDTQRQTRRRWILL